ncbi:MAG: ISL3 family transposase [Gemmatimonadota bacterium]|nr:ISL3 family transposase [Gemmatimonadota bacterium]
MNDTTHSGKPVVIDWQRQRYKCQACGGTFVQPVTDIDERHLMTTRLVQHIERSVLTRTHVAVAAEIGVSEGTIRNVFRAYAERMASRHVFQAPEILGIDELHICGRARCVLTNIGDKLILDFLEDRTRDLVYHALIRLEDRHRVEVVAMDMHPPYLTVTKLAFPKATPVVDKFHILRMASLSLDALRKLVGKRVSRRRGTFIKRNLHVLLARPANLRDEQRLLLSEWLGEIPELRAAYDLKEQFYDIWEHRTVGPARKALHAWRAAVPPHLAAIFKPLVTASTNWETEILNYFVTGGVTNAFTEATNRNLRDVDRAGRSYSFEALRIMALFAHGGVKYHRPARLGLERRDVATKMMPYGLLPFDPPVALGIPLSTFVSALKKRP